MGNFSCMMTTMMGIFFLVAVNISGSSSETLRECKKCRNKLKDIHANCQEKWKCTEDVEGINEYKKECDELHCPFNFNSELIKKIEECRGQLESTNCKRCLQFTIDSKIQCREGKIEDKNLKMAQHEYMCIGSSSCKEETKKKIEAETTELIECMISI